MIRTCRPLVGGMVAMLALAGCTGGSGSAAPGPDALIAPAPSTTAGPRFTPSFAAADCPAAISLNPEGTPAGPPATDPATRCGYVTVPTRHDDLARGKIELAVAVLPALPAPSTPADPAAKADEAVMVLGGGPGQPMVDDWSFLAGESPERALRQDRDLIVLDQRGVGRSRPSLDCPLPDDADLDAAGLKACRDRLVREGVDLSAFTSAHNARDLDLVREALGYRRVALYGTSYGTVPALLAAKLFPATISGVVLSSPVPVEEVWIDDNAATFDRAVRALSDACTAEAACRAEHPDVYGSLVEVLTKLPAAARPDDLDAPVSRREMAADALFGALYEFDGPASFPYLASTLAAWADGPADAPPPAVLERFAGFGPEEVPPASGMALSVLCAEQFPRVTEPATAGALARLLASEPGFGLALFREQCPVWAVDPAPADDLRRVEGVRVPMLIITGQFDPITPPALGRAILDANPGAVLVEMKGAGHDPVSADPDCGMGLLDDFLADPQARLNTRCADRWDGFTSDADMAGMAAMLETPPVSPGSPGLPPIIVNATPGNEAACQAFASATEGVSPKHFTTEQEALAATKAVWAAMLRAAPPAVRQDLALLNAAVQKATSLGQLFQPTDREAEAASARSRAWLLTNCGISTIG